MQLGLTERTIFIFTSDNGGLHVCEMPNTPSTHNTPFRAGKGYLEEGGLREPLIVRWPGKIKAGVTNDTPVVLYDFMPTLMTAAGLDVAHTRGPARWREHSAVAHRRHDPAAHALLAFPELHQPRQQAGGRGARWRVEDDPGRRDRERSSCTTSRPIRGRRTISRKANRRGCRRCKGNWRRGGNPSARRWARRTRISTRPITSGSTKISTRPAWSRGRASRQCARSSWTGAKAWMPRSRATSRA